MEMPLSARQHEILSIIKRHIAERNSVPSYKQIGLILGCSSKATIAKHIAALEQKGHIKRVNDERGFMLLVEGFEYQVRERSRAFVLPSALRWEIWERDDFRCLRCGARRDLTVDHIFPWQSGGDKYDQENLQTLCRSCNSLKRSNTVSYRRMK